MSADVMPAQKDLDEVLARCTWVHLRPVTPRKPTPGLPLDVRDTAAVAALRTCLAIREDAEGFHCMCIGDFALELHDEQNLLAVLTMHHGVSIRWDRWTWDAALKDGPRLLDWFASVGLTKPREDAQEHRRAGEEAAAAEERWLAAMPACLRPLWRIEPGTGMVEDVGALRAPLAEAFPDVKMRILELFRWFGSGKGPWSGYPSYEGAAKTLLLDYPIPVLLSALEGRELSASELEGAARLFASGEFGRQGRQERHLIPKALREQMLAQALASQDKDKRIRAQYAFG
ncbi:hypothetical protein HPC49_30205 [Pyxidicoccus fallax]|uniref:Uncharacterized protein n=1 Tax=Pyxidicoccus fallax TaxID=394095 RepID=A0A848LEW3_9BACT|nr:hypothetical protein [Pyxidicoccus fallax]NMO17036.1 hypothetical protein [Pyxidicoccus fallax]NPC82482.1 hypothetical protein [Pyxidicoccus fallax]